MEELVQFIEKTKQLKRHLEKEFPKNEDESKEYTHIMNQLLEDRQQALNQFSTLKDLDEMMKRELIESENQIKLLMNNHSQKIKKDLRVLQMKKQKGNQYSNPYGNISADGMFLDKKK